MTHVMRCDECGDVFEADEMSITLKFSYGSTNNPTTLDFCSDECFEKFCKERKGKP